MYVVETHGISKIYGCNVIVDNLSLSLEQGQIMGLIGPNGAGKTTTLRMMMDIIKPDSGKVLILGEQMNADAQNHIGYLPEERGLYRKQKIIDSLVYLASLKGMNPVVARTRAMELLEKVGLSAHAEKKVEQLSHGMGQLVQLVSTIIHDPVLMIIDEPFNGLDPVNVQLVKDLMLELRSQNKSLILSTHRMNEVEEMCDRICMLNKGQQVLYGNLLDIKNRYRSNTLEVDYEGEFPPLSNVSDTKAANGKAHIILNGSTTAQDVLVQLVKSGLVIHRFEIATPTLNDIFISIAGKKNV
ncbi:ABC transporter ATP-binding protein [Dehalococcoides mccartyi]|jgi:ABC-2 type transport system ATP-binding protein|uniref:ABC transporter ATP-binding protein n=2 Tax=Dehalococcoides mccartyi TaxID=61435 RepID=A0A142V9Q4_9CHLR|nr:ABC transporter ATP-binding protein [Dehalococcoides mccartyi]AII60941.1 sodium ABC transporter [Dehalococcoides mccartyi CG5]AMU86564.1 ABC transporter ATP-binding protein [Dehalococcoides mccartyi]AOV99387.1 ABC transporter, ATP-binding protein [Dehalococcoides mccartyi]MBA2085175.1 ABC transporter, ATP-binding protein [Dehalococcoides mccartyi]QBX63892.1 ATP-binding cassette domain-containing protein [Dehalococcoides mccartyi]